MHTQNNLTVRFYEVYQIQVFFLYFESGHMIRCYEVCLLNSFCVVHSQLLCGFEFLQFFSFCFGELLSGLRPEFVR